jgi:hypothetical protein
MVGIIACLWAWNAGSISAFQAAPGATGSPSGDDATPVVMSTGLEDLDLTTGSEVADPPPGPADIDPTTGSDSVTPTSASVEVVPTPASVNIDQANTSARTMRTITSTFLELGHGDRTVTSSEAFLEYAVPVPPGLVPVGDSRLSLVISHSPLLHPDTSSMTVLANGTPILSTFLDESNETQARIELQVPDSAFTADGVTIQVAFSLHLSEDSCDVGEDEARWATVHGNSSYAFATAHDAGTADLATIDRQFTDPSVPVTIVLPVDPSAAEREAAGKIAFEIGRWNGTSRVIPRIAHASLPAQPLNGAAIFIGTGSTMGDRHAWTGIAWNDPAFTTANGAIHPDHGILALIQTPFPSLLVSGTTDQAVTKAVNALLEPGIRESFSGPFAIVTGQEPVAPVAPGAWYDNSATFGLLGFDERELRGNGTHTIDLLLRRPANWVAGDGGNLTLELQTSSAVVPDLSRLTVSVNGHQLGSNPIAPGSETTSYVFDLPANAVNSTPAGQPTGMLLVTAAAPCGRRLPTARPGECLGHPFAGFEPDYPAQRLHRARPGPAASAVRFHIRSESVPARPSQQSDVGRHGRRLADRRGVRPGQRPSANGPPIAHDRKRGDRSPACLGFDGRDRWARRESHVPGGGPGAGGSGNDIPDGHVQPDAHRHCGLALVGCHDPDDPAK